MITFDTSDAHSPWTNLGEVLGQVSQSPSDSFNAAFLRVCEIRDALLALAREPNAPLDDRIVAARRFDPHRYTEIFPFDPKQWREKNCDRYDEYRGRLDDWIGAEDPGPAAELKLFGEHLDLLALHYQLGKEVISRQKLIDKVFGSYTRLRRAADRLPEVAGWSRRLVDVLNATVLRWYGGVLVLVLALVAILILGLFQWQGIIRIQEALRAEIQQGIASTREDADRAVMKAENVASRFAALEQQFDGIEQDQQWIATMQNQLQGLQRETMRLAKMMEEYPNIIHRFEERLVTLDDRILRLEGTIGEQVVIGESLLSTPVSSAKVSLSSIPGEITSPPPTVIPDEPEPVQPESESSPSILARLTAMEADISETKAELSETKADLATTKEILRSSEEMDKEIEKSASRLRDSLKRLRDAR